MSHFRNLIIRADVESEEASDFVPNKNRVVKVTFLDDKEEVIEDYSTFTNIGLDPEAIIGMTVEEAKTIIEKLKDTVDVRILLKKKGLIDYIVNVAPFTDANDDLKL
jgi:hypothetical protein